MGCDKSKKSEKSNDTSDTVKWLEEKRLELDWTQGKDSEKAERMLIENHIGVKLKKDGRWPIMATRFSEHTEPERLVFIQKLHKEVYDKHKEISENPNDAELEIIYNNLPLEGRRELVAYSINYAFRQFRQKIRNIVTIYKRVRNMSRPSYWTSFEWMRDMGASRQHRAKEPSDNAERENDETGRKTV